MVAHVDWIIAVVECLDHRYLGIVKVGMRIGIGDDARLHRLLPAPPDGADFLAVEQLLPARVPRVVDL